MRTVLSMIPVHGSRLAVYAAALLSGMIPCHAEPVGAGITVGIEMRKNFYTQFGPSLEVWSGGLMKGRPRLGACWTSSRPSAAWSNRLEKDDFILVSSWYFRPGCRWRPVVALHAGWTGFGYESEELFSTLDASAPVVALLAGVSVRFWKQRLRARADIGYSFISSSTVYPLTMGLGIGYAVGGSEW